MKLSCNHCGKRFVTQDEIVIGRVYRIPCRCGNSIILRVDASLRDRGAPSPCKPPEEAPPPLPLTCARGATARAIEAAVRSRWPASATEARAPGAFARVADMEAGNSRPIACAPPVSLRLAAPGCGPSHASTQAPALSAHDDPFGRRALPEPPLASSREFTLVPGATPLPAGHGLARRDPDASAEDAAERTGPHWVPLEWARRTLRTRAFVAGVGSGAVVALFVLVGLAVAGTPSGTVVAMPAAPENDTPTAAVVTPPPKKAPPAPRARRASPSATGPEQTAIVLAAAPRLRPPELVRPDPDAPSSNRAASQVPAPSNAAGSVDPVDSMSSTTNPERQEPVADDAEAVAGSGSGAPQSGDAADQEDDAQRDDAPKPEAVADEADRDTDRVIDPVAADHRPKAEDTPGDASTAPAPASAVETIATTNASR